MMRLRLIASMVALASCVGSVSEIRAGVVWGSGHGDLAVHYETGELHVGLHFHDEAFDTSGDPIPEGEYEGDEVAIFVDGPALARPDGSQWDFTGAAAGESLWLISSVSDPARPYLGWSTEELNLGDWQDGVIQFALAGILSGPSGGVFSIWGVDGFGAPQVKASSLAGEVKEFESAIPVHSHLNLGFTKAGTYEVEVKVRGVYVGGGGAELLESSGVFTFHVGSVPDPVPEPASMAVFGMLIGGMGIRTYRRRRFNAKATG
jgi:surface-anchored protein